MFRYVLLLAGCAFASPDLVAPFTVDLRSSSHPVWDTIDIKVYLQNRGNTGTPSLTYAASAVAVGLDSFPVENENFAISYVLNGGFFTEYSIKTISPKGPFSIHTRCDPLNQLGQSGGDLVNDVRSQAYNFHPTIARDTIVMYDTVRIATHDTVVRVDTVYKTPTLAKASARIAPTAVRTEVYNAIGKLVWDGMLRQGEYPPVRLKQGLHILVQAGKVRRFRVAYK